VPLIVYHGGFSPERGLEELAEAALQPGLEDARVAYLGYGSLRDRLDSIAAEERFGKRLHVVDAVPPEELLGWVADADVSVMAIRPTTLNHRLATPNKLFESLTAGVPVVASDLPAMAPIVCDDPAGPLGALCDPDDPVSIGTAIRSILELPAADRSALRERCRMAALERWNWETESARLLALYDELGA
jgi:glycosyltransferase involved in cell wall biosynthesis